MKLYYSPLACSLAAHIACKEGGIDVELERVELWTKRTASGTDLFAANAMGQVPTLVLDDGRVITENVAVLAYLGELAPKGPLAGAAADAVELVRWLAFVTTELHKKVLAPIYNPGAPDAVKDYARGSAPLALKFAAARLESRETLLAGDFSVADAYLFWALTLMPHAGIPLDAFPALLAYHQNHRKRPAVRAAFRFEKEELERPFAA
jgi:glutathione S-transferase